MAIQVFSTPNPIKFNNRNNCCIKPHLKDMIDYYKSKGEWKIQITMRIIFISFIDKNKTQVMHTKSDNVKIINVLILVMLLMNLLILL